MPKLRAEYQRVRERLEASTAARDLLGIRAARANAFRSASGPAQPPPLPQSYGVQVVGSYPLADLVDYIDWSPFFVTWGVGGAVPADSGRSGGWRGGTRALSGCPSHAEAFD